jgi:hypothetical protein
MSTQSDVQVEASAIGSTPLAADTSARVLVWVRRVAVTAWAVALVAYCIRDGIPFDRLNQTLWILAGLLASLIGRDWLKVRRLVLDWLPFVALLYLYDYSRGAADALGRPVQVVGPLEIDRFLLFGHDGSVWLQQHLYDPAAVHWYDTVGSLIYISHFIAAWAIAAILYFLNRDEWFKWARAVLLLSLAALITFALMPAAPPWYAAREGLLQGPIERISTRGLSPLGLHGASELVKQGQAVVNEVAAIPSLHTGFAVLIAAWFWMKIPRAQRWWGWPLLAAYPVLMLATLVYSGEHYVIDGLIGAVYVGGVLGGLALWDRWRRDRLDAAQPAAETARA